MDYLRSARVSLRGFRGMLLLCTSFGNRYRLLGCILGKPRLKEKKNTLKGKSKWLPF